MGLVDALNIVEDPEEPLSTKQKIQFLVEFAFKPRIFYQLIYTIAAGLGLYNSVFYSLHLLGEYCNLIHNNASQIDELTGFIPRFR